MEASKFTALMEDWKNNSYTNTNADIFEFINRAIMVAASDHPTEFRIKRHKIARTLFSPELIKSSEYKKPSNMASCTEIDDETKKVLSKVLRKIAILDKSGDKSESEQVVPTCKQRWPNMALVKLINTGMKFVIPKGPVTPEKKVQDHGAKEVEEALKIKKILDKSGDESESEPVVCDSLTKLQDMGLSMETLKATGIGKSVSLLIKHSSKNVSQIAVTLVKAWKGMVEEWIKKQSQQKVKPTSTVVNMNAGKKLAGISEKVMNPSEKLEAKKRKLKEGYERGDNYIKRQRRMDLHKPPLMFTYERRRKQST